MKYNKIFTTLGSLRLKTAVLVLFLFLALATFAAKEFTDFQRNHLIKQADNQASLLAGIIADDVSEAMVRGDAGDVQKIMEKLGTRARLSGIWLTDAKGTIYASSRREDVGRNYGTLSTLLSKEKPGSGMVLSRTVEIRNNQRCIGCHGKAPVLGRLIVGVSYTKTASGLLILKKWLALGSLFFAAFAAISLVALITRFFTAPARALATAIVKAGADAGVPVERPLVDFRMLFNSFNSLMAGITAQRESAHKAHMDELRKYSKELESINRSLDEKINMLSALTGISRSMNATHRLDDLLRMIITSAARELKADCGSVMLFEKGVNELFIQTGKGLSPEGQRRSRFKLGEGVAGWVAENRQPVLLEDAYSDPRFLRGRGFRSRMSLVSVPLISSTGDVLGVINLERGLASQPFRQADMDYLMAMAGQASVAVENVELFQNLQKSYYDTIYALAQAVEAKDPYTVGHCDRVTQYSIAIGEELGLSGEDIAVLQYGATLHDLGKIGISEAVLNKPGRLTEEEFEIMKEHAAIGENIVRGVDFLQKVRPIIRNHQERYDGAGYPDGLKGDEIPLTVAIVTVADNLDALTSDRPYRPAKPLMEALEIIKSESGKKYNPKVVEAFLKIFGGGDECRLSA